MQATQTPSRRDESGEAGEGNKREKTRKRGGGGGRDGGRGAKSELQKEGEPSERLGGKASCGGDRTTGKEETCTNGENHCKGSQGGRRGARDGASGVERGAEGPENNDKNCCLLSIKVAGEEGETLKIKVAKNISIEELKKELKKRLVRTNVRCGTVAHEDLRLIYAGRQLEADKTMEDYSLGTQDSSPVSKGTVLGSGGGASAVVPHTIHVVIPHLTAVEAGAPDDQTPSPVPKFCCSSRPSGHVRDSYNAGAGGRAGKEGQRVRRGGGERAGRDTADKEKEARKDEDKKTRDREEHSTDFRIPCQAMHYATAKWCRAERGGRASLSEVVVYFNNHDLPSHPESTSGNAEEANSAAGGGVKGASRRGFSVQVTREEHLRLRGMWWKAIKHEDVISLQVDKCMFTTSLPLLEYCCTTALLLLYYWYTLQPIEKLKYPPFELAAGADKVANSVVWTGF